MNNKTKIMLGLSVLTAGTLAAGATGTLAWFTTNKTATATYSNITAASTTGNLKASIAGVTDKDAKSAAYDYNVTAKGTANSKTADVSSQDGLTFGQPKWVGVAGNADATAITGVKQVYGTKGYFTQYTVSLQNVKQDNGENAAIRVSLTGVSIIGGETGGTELAGWTRVAINTAVNGDGDALVAAKDNKTYLYQTADITTQNRYTPVSDTPTTIKEATKTIDGTKVTLATAKDVLDTPVELATNLGSTGTSTITIGVSVWMEGTMADQDTAKGQSVSVKLTFKGEE